MRRIIFTLIVNTLCTLAIAQPNDEPMSGKRGEKIEVLKRTFFNEQLALTEAEKEKFWPIYDSYKEKRDALKKEVRKAHANLEKETVSENEALEVINLMARKRKSEIDLDSGFLKECLPILGPKRVISLVKLEREFQKTLMDKLKKNRQERRQVGGPPPNRPMQRR